MWIFINQMHIANQMVRLGHMIVINHLLILLFNSLLSTCNCLIFSSELSIYQMDRHISHYIPSHYHTTLLPAHSLTITSHTIHLTLAPPHYHIPNHTLSLPSHPKPHTITTITSQTTHSHYYI